MAHINGIAYRAGGAGSDAVADAGFILYGCDWLEMSTRRNLYLLLVGLALIAVSLACGLGSAPEASAPLSIEQDPAAEEPAAPEMTAPAEEQTAPDAVPPPPPSSMLTPTAPATLPDVGWGGEEPQPAIPESRRLTLEFPPVMRTGDSVRIRLQLEVDDRGGIVPTAIVKGNVVTGEVVEIPNLYETHLVVAEARLDMAGMEVRPPGTISEPMTPGKAVTFYWSVRPEESGKYEGTVWLHLRFVPMADLNGEQEGRIPVSVQFLEIEAKSFVGMFSGGTARGVGVVGSIVGSILGFPFVDDILKWILRGRKRK